MKWISRFPAHSIELAFDGRPATAGGAEPEDPGSSSCFCVPDVLGDEASWRIEKCAGLLDKPGVPSMPIPIAIADEHQPDSA